MHVMDIKLSFNIVIKKSMSYLLYFNLVVITKRKLMKFYQLDKFKAKSCHQIIIIYVVTRSTFISISISSVK